MPMPEEYMAEKHMEYFERVAYPSSEWRQQLLTELRDSRRSNATNGKQPGPMTRLRRRLASTGARLGVLTAVRRLRGFEFPSVPGITAVDRRKEDAQ